MKLLIVLVANGLLLATLLTGCSVTPAPQPPPLQEDGATLYREACAGCHGDDGKGNKRATKLLKIEPTDLTRLSQRNGGAFPRDRVIAVLAGEVTISAHGDREMPVWKQRFAPSGQGATAVAAIYARRQLDELANYLETIQLPASK